MNNSDGFRRSSGWVGFVVCMGAMVTSAQAQRPGAVFDQDPLGDGVVSIEAEHYQGVTTGTQTWPSQS